MNHKLLFIPVALAILLPVQAYATSTGYATSTASTCGCHGSLSTDVTTTITGLSTIAPGATQTYTTTLTGTLLTGAGLNVRLTGLGGASLGDVEANTQVITSSKATAPYAGAPQITHVDSSVAAPAGNSGDWSYNFTLTAPLTLGTIVLNSVMLAFDGSTDESGDLWNNLTFSVQVIPEPSTILLLGAGMAGLAALGRRRR
jgi:hypothetical protein